MALDWNVFAPCFRHQLEALIKKYSRSKNDIEDALAEFAEKPNSADRIPGFGDSTEMRKGRIALKAYNIGASKGLRAIFLVSADKKDILWVSIYSKSDYNSEKKTRQVIKDNLRSILSG